MITYSDIEYKDNGRDDLQFEKIVKLMGRSEDISKLGEYFISSLSEGESIKCTHTKLISKIIRRLSNSEILLPITLISKQQLDEVFELFEKQLKENVFLSSNKDRLLFDLYDDEVIVDKTKEIPTQLSKDISSMGLLQMLTSGDVFCSKCRLVDIMANWITLSKL